MKNLTEYLYEALKISSKYNVHIEHSWSEFFDNKSIKTFLNCINDSGLHLKYKTEHIEQKDQRTIDLIDANNIYNVSWGNDKYVLSFRFNTQHDEHKLLIELYINTHWKATCKWDGSYPLNDAIARQFPTGLYTGLYEELANTINNIVSYFSTKL